MKQQNSSSIIYDTNTVTIPNDTMEFYDWIVPLPWWHVTTSSWGPMWGVHVYGMAACYAFLTLASAATYAHFRPKTKRLGVVLPLLTFLVLVGGLRLAFCLTRPYDFKDTLVGALSRLLLHLVSPFLCGAYALTQAMLSKITGLAIGSRRFRNAWVVLLGVVGLVVCTVTTHSVVLFHRPIHVLLMVDSVVSVAWLLYLSVKFTCSGFLLMQFALDAEVARKCLLATRDRRRNRELSAGASSTGCLNLLCDVILKRGRTKGCRRYHNVSGDEYQTRPSSTFPPSPAPSLSGISPEYPLDVWDTLFEYSSPDTEICFQDCGFSNGTLTDEPVYRSLRRCKRLSLPTEKGNSQYVCGSESTEKTRAPFLLRKLSNFENERKPPSYVPSAQVCRRQHDLRVRGVIQETQLKKRRFETRRRRQYSESSERDMSNTDSDSCQVSCHHHYYHTRQNCEKEKNARQNVLLRSCDLTHYCDRSVNSLHDEICNECKTYRADSSECKARVVKEDFTSEASFEAREVCEKKCGIGIQPQDVRPQGHNISLTDERKTHAARHGLDEKEPCRADIFCLTEGHDRSILHENVAGTITTQLISQNPTDVVRKSKTLGKVDKGKRMIVKTLCEQESPRGFPFTWKCHGSINTKRRGECAPVHDGKRPRHAHGRDMVLRILRLFLKRWRGHVSDRQGLRVRHFTPRERWRQIKPDAGSATSNDDDDDSISSCEGDAGYLADNEHTQSPLISKKKEMKQLTASSANGSNCSRTRYQINFFPKMSTGRSKFLEHQRTGVVFQEARLTSEKCSDDGLYSLSATGLVNHPGCLLHSETSFTFLPSLASPLNSRGSRELRALGTSGAGSFSYSPPAAQDDAVGRDGTFSSDRGGLPRGRQHCRVFTESSDSLELCWNVLTGKPPQKTSGEHGGTSPKASGTNPPTHAQSSACVGLLRIRQAGMLRRSVQGMYLLTFVNLFACLLNLYSIFGRYGVLWSRSTTIAPEPWSWLAFQTLLRLTEVTMSYLTLAIVFNILRHHKRRWK